MNNILIILKSQGRSKKWLKRSLSVSYGTINNWCSNITQPNIDKITKISILLNVPVEQLICTKDKQL